MGLFSWFSVKKEAEQKKPTKKICCACPETKVSYSLSYVQLFNLWPCPVDFMSFQANQESIDFHAYRKLETSA
jgi:hypothetical protein